MPMALTSTHLRYFLPRVGDDRTYDWRVGGGVGDEHTYDL